MAAATNVAAGWGDITKIPVCERRCVCGRGFLYLCLSVELFYAFGLIALLLSANAANDHTVSAAVAQKDAEQKSSKLAKATSAWTIFSA